MSPAQGAGPDGRGSSVDLGLLLFCRLSQLCPVSPSEPGVKLGLLRGGLGFLLSLGLLPGRRDL